ncbi:hypothetical protein EF888_06270 [Silicimonas algicola]|uniref:PH (Pleckstrin Homology) domain-containing protein n=1 Tax=Silicimonas algicola TaxID=1826607 RepID=A0A316FWB6_9RHOB|nr:hypothetical protein [Silicimonas algicola]AZQ66779.1 hypothetical protein EF888_06270 [Silicimonas algicola]PWK53104.1 hypothetical protein C8D95_1146 [Silicimonas algicola]
MTAGERDGVLISISASPMRRWLGVLCLAALGVLMFTLAVDDLGGLWRLLFLALGLVAVWFADALRRATQDSLVLTRAGLSTSSGRMLAPVDDIYRVESGVLAFKPSNGFLVRLKTPQPWGWAPGLWWVRGRSLGIGGVVGGGQARAMAELLSALVEGVLPER